MPWLPRLAMFAAVAVASACGGDGTTAPDGVEMPPANEAPADPLPSAIEGRECPPGSVLTGENFGRPFLLTWCNGCHSAELPANGRQGAPVGVDFDTDEGVRQHLQRIYARAADNNATMPPAAGPGLEERELLGEWLACGAP